MKSEAGSKSTNSRLRPHLTIDLHYGIIDFPGFLLLRVTDRADFYITQIEAYREFFEEKISAVLAFNLKKKRFVKVELTPYMIFCM